MSLKVILSLTTIFFFTSLLPTTVVAAEPPAEPNPSPLDELAERLKQGTENEIFFRENAHIVIIDLLELMDEDRLWESTPINPEQWRQFTQEMEDVDLRAAAPTLPQIVSDPDNPETSPVDILIVIDDSSNMRRNRELPISPEQRKQWESFKQTVANMSFNKVSLRMRFSLNEDGQLMCWHSIVHGPLDCEYMVRVVSSWMEKAEVQDSITVSNTEPLIQNFIVQELTQIESAEKMRVLEQFMKDHELSTWAVAMTSTSGVETQDQPSE